MEISVLLFFNAYLILFLADKDNWVYIIGIDFQKDLIISFYNYLKLKGYMNNNVLNKLLFTKWEHLSYDKNN